jgi:hypothetical protein
MNADSTVSLVCSRTNLLAAFTVFIAIFGDPARYCCPSSINDMFAITMTSAAVGWKTAEVWQTHVEAVIVRRML